MHHASTVWFVKNMEYFEDPSFGLKEISGFQVKIEKERYGCVIFTVALNFCNKMYN